MKQKPKWIIALILIPLTSLPIQSWAQPSGPTLSALLETAYENNPSIAAARQGWRAAIEKFRVATGYPDPQLMVTYFPEPIQTRLGPQDFNATLTQPIPFPGKLKKAGEAARAEADIARLALDRAVREVAVALRRSWWELYYIRQAQAVARANAELVAHIRTVAETAHADDRALFSDMVKAQSQAGQLQYDQLLLMELEATEITRINGLLNRAPEAAIGPFEAGAPATVAYSLEELYALAEAHREEIRMAGIRAEQADIQVDLAGYERLPDFRVGIFYAAIGRPDMEVADAGRDAVGVQFGVQIPVWIGKNKGRIESARAMAEKARAEMEQSVSDTRTRIREAFFRLENARRLMTLYGEELLPQAARSLSAAETWFQAGESNIGDLIETQSVYYNFQLSLARSTADAGKAMANLEALVGRDIARRGVE